MSAKAIAENKMLLMRKIYIWMTLLVLGTVLLNSCKKDSDIFVPDPGQQTGPDSNWYSPVTASMPVNKLESNLFIPADVNTIVVNDQPDTVITSSGLICLFPPYSCVDSTGAPVTGSVTVESNLFISKGDLIRMGMPTTSNGNLLVSGGVVSLRLKQNNQHLQLAPGVGIAMRFTNAPQQQQMQYFIGDQTPDGFNWVQKNNDSNKVYNSPGSEAYQVYTTNLRTINCDYFYGDTSNTTDKTILSVKLTSPNLTNANTVSYVVFKDLNSLMVMRSDASAKLFTCGKIPIGRDVTIVTISKDGNFYYLGQQEITTAAPAAGSNSVAVTITPQRLSIDQIKAFLNTL